MADPADLSAALAEARDVTREQLQAAWRRHVERVQEQLEAGWRDEIQAALEQRFAELEPRVERACQAAVEARVADEGAARRRELSARLNLVVRRLRDGAGHAEWLRALMDGAGGFCGRAAMFEIAGGRLRLEAAGGWYDEAGFQRLHQEGVPLEAAPAFSSAVEAGDAMVALGAASQVSEAVAAFFDLDASAKVYLFPLLVRDAEAEAAGPRPRVAAILYAEAGAEGLDSNALEMLAAWAGLTLDYRAREARAASHAPGAVSAEWPPEDRAAHLEARRFARTRTAAWLLERYAEVKKGRSERNIYGTLREEIESGRHAFRERFLPASSTMVDYLHQELVRTVAAGDAGLLGADYPGPLR